MASDALRVDVVQAPTAKLPRRVSYSQMSLHYQCGLKYFFQYLAGWREPPSAALACGTITHEVIEHLYRLPAKDRTLERAMELLREHGARMLKMPEYRKFESDKEMKWQVRNAVENLFEVEDPKALDVKSDHLEMELEVEINGVEFFGKVDRYTADGIHRVTDYKTGRAPGRFIDDKLVQPLLYALAFKLQYDIEVDEVELIYLNAKEVVRRPADPKLTVQMGDKLSTMREASMRDFAECAWDARPQVLCNYCVFQPACPARNPDAPQPGTSHSDQVLAASGSLQRNSGSYGNGNSPTLSGN